MDVSKRLFQAVIALAVLLLLAIALQFWMHQSMQTRMEALERQTEEFRSDLDKTIETALRTEKYAAQVVEQRDQAREESRQSTERAKKAELETDRMQADLERVTREKEAELDRLQKRLGRIAETRRTALGVVMNLGSDSMQFDYNRAELRPENRELLSRIVGVLLTLDGYSISVYGHTDDIGSEEYNQTLSEQRATAVRNYLVSAGVDPEIISMQGFGKTRPLVKGTDDVSRARNRRVEIAVVMTQIDYDPLPKGAPKG